MGSKTFRTFASRIIRHGSLEIEEPDGEVWPLGDGTGAAPRIKFTDAKVAADLMHDPELAFGELFMDGRIQVVRGTIYDVVAIILANLEDAAPISPWLDLLRKSRAGVERFVTNNLKRAQSNVAHHYDIGNALYELFLDKDWQYSCAYFETPDADLDTAQEAKKRHIAAKLALTPGQRVLDIGCGWGGMALYLARECGVHVTGVTLSKQQHAKALERARAEGLESQLDFRFQDYRNVEGPFDRIVSVGMFEHVGESQYGAFFARLAALLKPDGVALLHTIGTANPDFRVGPWARKYIFPGTAIPTLSQLARASECAKLMITDVEVLRLHYARTLQLWRSRFLANRDRALALFDERFCRMWEFYLSSSQCMFEYQGCSIFQLQLTRRVDTLPVTRNYMMARERQLGQPEAAAGGLDAGIPGGFKTDGKWTR